MVPIGLSLISVGMIGFALTLHYASSQYVNSFFLISALVTGIGTSFYHPIGAAILQSSFEKNRRGRALGVNGAFGGIGRAVYPSIVAVFVAVYTYSIALLIVAAIGFVGSLAVSLGLRSRRIVESPKTSVGKSSIVQRGEISAVLILLTVVAFAVSFSTQGIGAWIPSFLAAEKGLGTSATLDYEVSALYAASILGQPFFGYLSDKIDKRIVVAIAVLGSSSSVLGYLFSHGILDIVFLEMIGFFTFTNFPVFLSLVSDYVPSSSSAFSNGLVWNFGVSGGGVAGPAVVAAFVFSGLFSWTRAFEIMIAVAFLSSAMIPILRKPVQLDEKAAPS